MKNDKLMQSLKERIKAKRRRKWHYTFSVAMSALIVFCTVYALILPAITLVKTQKILDCPLAVHPHKEDCYDENGELICGMADFVLHTHDSSCYDENGILVCTLPEIEAHEHTDECFAADKILICGKEEGEDAHTHTDECYRTETVLVCNNQAILHKHSESCYDDSGSLICGQLEVMEHQHEEGCFVQAKDSEEKLLMAPYGAVLSAWAEVEEAQAVRPASHALMAASDIAPQEGGPADLSPYLTEAKIQVNNVDYDGSPLDRNSSFTVFLQSGINNNELSYQYVLPDQIVVKDTGSATQPLTLMYGDTQIGSYYIKDNTVYIDYLQSYTGVTTKLELSASWSKDVEDHETIDWGNGKTTDVEFIDENIVIQKSDTNNGVMQVVENGDLYAEYIIRAMLEEGGKLKISDELTNTGNGIVRLWRGAYENGTADYEWSIHTYSGNSNSPDAGQVGDTQYGVFLAATATSFSIENESFDLEAGQYVEIKYKVRVDVNDRIELDGNKTKLEVKNKATATSTSDDKITSSMTHNVVYQADSQWVQKTNTNTDTGSNADNKWMVTINAKRNYDMEGTVVMDNISSSGTTYNTGSSDFTVTITGENGTSTSPLKVIDIENIESILTANGTNVDAFESYIAYDLGNCQNIEEMNQKINDFQSIFQQLLGTGQTVDAALLSQYVFVDNRDETKKVTGNTGPLFLWVAPPNSAVSNAGSVPYSYSLKYSTHSEEGATGVVNQAAANWRGIYGGTGPITTLRQQVAIEKSNAGVYTGADGNLYVDWTINVTVPANSAAIPNVWLVDHLPSAVVKVAGENQYAFPSMVGVSNTLDRASLVNYDTEFGNKIHYREDNDTFEYLHSLVEGVFTFAGSGEDADAAEIAASAYPVLGAPGYSLAENFMEYSGLAERLGTMTLNGEDATVSPRKFGIWFKELPATTEGYTIEIKYTTKVNPYTMPLATQDYVTGTNTVYLCSDLGTGNYTSLADAHSQYWLARQSAEDSVVKNIVGFNPTSGVLTYRVELDPLQNLNVGQLAYQIHDSLSKYPGATYNEDSFKLYVHAQFGGTGIQNWIWNYDPTVEQLIWASDPSVFDSYAGDSFEKQMYEYLSGRMESTQSGRVVSQVSNDESGSSNFYLTLINDAWLGTKEGRFVPLTLEYKVQLPQNSTLGARCIDNEVLFSAYNIGKPDDIYLIGASYASFDTQNIMHKALYQAPSLQNNYMAGFQININRYESEDLMNAKEITLQDELSDTLRLVVSSIRLEGKNLNDADWAEISSDGWRVWLNEGESGNGFNVTIYTDKEDGNTVYDQYRLTYLTKVLGDTETMVHYSNQATIQSLGITSEKIERNVFIQRVSGEGSIFNLKITALKVDGNDMTKQLEGVTFELYTLVSEGESDTWVKQNTTEALTTDKNGEIQLTNTENGVSLKYNTWYALKETSPKADYLPIEPIYFYIPQPDTNPPTDPPFGVNGEKLISGQRVEHEGELTIENRTPSFTLEKRDAETGDLIYDAGFTLYSDQDCTQVVKKLESSTSGAFIFENLSVNMTYYLKETKIPTGYLDPKAVYQVNVDEDGNVTIQKLDANGYPITDGSSEIQQNGQSAVFVAYNKSISYELPATGGVGTTLYTLGGILLMAAPLVYGYKTKRRGGRRA